jgi:hypothetical protein
VASGWGVTAEAAPDSVGAPHATASHVSAIVAIPTFQRRIKIMGKW